MFLKSIQLIPFESVLKCQESAILKASQDWHQAQVEANGLGIADAT